MRTLRLLVPTVVLATALAACGADTGVPAVAEAHETAGDDVKLRRVWAGSFANFYASEPSPDGRYVSEIDWESGDLAVRDLLTGELRRVTDKKTGWVDSTDYAEHSSWSPDGRRLAYSWFSESGDGYELRTIGMDGFGMRVLVPAHPDIRYIAAEDWSPDGRWILTTVFRSDRSSQIAVVSAEDGSMRVLKTSDWRHPFVAFFSPDSRWLAYDFQPDEDSRQRDVFLMPLDGSRETKVVGGPSHDILLGWIPDGGSILFYSDRENARGIWQQAVADGRGVGEPRLIQPDIWQLFPMGFSHDAYYYGVVVESPQVHTASLDLGARRVSTPPAAVQDASAGQSFQAEWSSDGRFLAFLRRAPDDRVGTIVIRSTAGQDEREIRLDITQTRNLQWFPDNRALAVFGTDRKGREGIFRVDARSGEHELLLQRTGEPFGALGHFRLGPDGRTIYFKRAKQETEAMGMRRKMNVIARDLETGEERVLHEIASAGPVFVSPDGRDYASREIDLEARRRMVVVGRTDGTGELRTVFETPNRLLNNRIGIQWTPDGRHILVSDVPATKPNPEFSMANGPSRLLMVPADGGPATVLLEWPGQISNLRLSPDGRRVSFETGKSRDEIWRVENLPATPAVATAASGSR